VGSIKEALKARDYRAALVHAEATIPYARNNSAPRRHAAMAACYLHDEKRARAHFAKLPKGDVQNRITVVKVCRARGHELGDLLTELEAVRARD
jgi:hypothetical protein